MISITALRLITAARLVELLPVVVAVGSGKQLLTAITDDQSSYYYFCYCYRRLIGQLWRSGCHVGLINSITQASKI